ncbi:large conductance mechanosensitive channel protein MscL [Thermoleptolyngbya sichuanensis XZ-Cy5]|uniref:large conductance mechanosensitive channel protein MscL n=1 Tax=Thermoleptolyngbya sichuanensis TaxID=2885951 RepID=UPI00240D84AF|nr:large conductance mechanosensitive channel protein MscL [Thermoleptolyngbya sichuanensis]MDG2615112.1 large conductance mechanosensitive channel protein MscL [Thermoleptolyngbya sichuanensis XZ-Cy5]
MARRNSAVGGFLRDFREFALKGNVVDLAVGVIIGAAFGSIVQSLVDDIIMPIIAMIFGADPAAGIAGVTIGAIRVGNFLAAIINFLIISFSLYLLIKWFSAFKRREEEPAAPDLAEVNARLTDALERLTESLERR